jgi:hypothetical protein
MNPTCVYCGTAVDARAIGTWRRVVGWERKADAASRKSGSDIALREARNEYACNACVSLLKAGLSTRQESLL